MRILMISDVYFPRVNGVSTSIQTYRQSLQQQGHHVTLIAPCYGSEQDDDEDILRIPSRKVMFDPEDRMMKYGEVIKMLPGLRERNFDLIHIQTPFVAHYLGVRLARELGIPHLLTYHTFFEEYLYNYIPFLPKGWLRFVARRFSRSQCNQVDGIVVPSSPIEERLRDYGVESNIVRIPTGLNMSRFEGGDSRRFRSAYQIPESAPMLLYVGRVAHEKNIEFLLDVVAKIKETIPEILFTIAGEGPAVPRLEKLVVQKQLQGNVMFIGYLDRKRGLLDCYRSGDVLLFSSKTETQGLVPLEAMAVGTPVVAMAILGTRDVLREGCGALVAEDDLNDFVAKTLRLLQDPELRRELGEQGKRYAQQWSAEALCETMVEFYEGLVVADREAVAPAE